MTSPLQKALDILNAKTTNLEELAKLANADPRTFYEGANLRGYTPTKEEALRLSFDGATNMDGYVWADNDNHFKREYENTKNTLPFDPTISWITQYRERVETLRPNPEDFPEYDLLVEGALYSLSLDTFEKFMVVDSTPTLSQFQKDELIKTFTEEAVKFNSLSKDHPEDIVKLLQNLGFDEADWLEAVKRLEGAVPHSKKKLPTVIYQPTPLNLDPIFLNVFFEKRQKIGDRLKSQNTAILIKFIDTAYDEARSLKKRPETFLSKALEGFSQPDRLVNPTLLLCWVVQRLTCLALQDAEKSIIIRVIYTYLKNYDVPFDGIGLEILPQRVSEFADKHNIECYNHAVILFYVCKQFILTKRNKEAVTIFEIVRDRFSSVDDPKIAEAVNHISLDAIEVYLLLGKNDQAVSLATHLMRADMSASQTLVIEFLIWLAEDARNGIGPLIDRLNAIEGESDSFTWSFLEIKPYLTTLIPSVKADAEKFVALYETLKPKKDTETEDGL